MLIRINGGSDEADERKGDRIQIWENGLRNAPNDPNGRDQTVFYKRDAEIQEQILLPE